MIQSALSLLFVSTTGVLIRCSGSETLGGPTAKWLCLAGLSTSFILLMGFYVTRILGLRMQRVPAQTSSSAMLKCLAWKHA